jgi:hypothetical protein
VLSYHIDHHILKGLGLAMAACHFCSCRTFVSPSSSFQSFSFHHLLLAQVLGKTA